MGTKHVLVVGAALASAALGVVAFASASPRAASTTLTIKTLMEVTAATTVDADHNGKPSIGDYTVFQAVHRDLKTHKVIGGGTAICTQITAGSLFDCQGEDHFAGGDIREAFRDREPAKAAKLAVLGGTGAYQGASGELNVTWLDAKETKAHAVFTIAKP